MVSDGRHRNALLTIARQRLSSPSGSGRVMSRQELADAVNAHLWNMHGLRTSLDATDIGKLERGEVRWPSAQRRQAFRAILGASNDRELGFFITRRPNDRSTVTVGSAVESCASTVSRPWLDGLRDVSGDVPASDQSDVGADVRSDEPVASRGHEPAGQAIAATDEVASVGSGAGAASMARLLESMSSVQRREFLARMVEVAGFGISASVGDVGPPFWDRLDAALGRTGEDAELAVDQLVTTSADLWQRYATTASTDLIGSVIGQLDVVVRLSELPMAPETRRRLRSAAGEVARQAGWFSFDVGNLGDAHRYYAVATRAAMIADDAELHAHVLGCLSYTTLHSQPQHALAVLVRTRQLAVHVSAPLRSWLAAVEAEAHAVAGQPRSCGDAVLRSQEHLCEHPGGEAVPTLVIDEARRKGFEGSCLVHLGDARRAIAQLETSLSLLPALDRHRANVLALLAYAHIQRGEIDGACQYLQQSLAITSHTRQRVGMQHVRRARAQLEPYRTSRAVKAIDVQLMNC